jgi:hypothetical protein
MVERELFRVQDLEMRVESAGLRLQGVGLQVQGSVLPLYKGLGFSSLNGSWN